MRRSRVTGSLGRRLLAAVIAAIVAGVVPCLCCFLLLVGPTALAQTAHRKTYTATPIGLGCNPQGINNHGEVVGGCAGSEPFMWTPTTGMQLLSASSPTRASDISDSRVAVGFSDYNPVFWIGGTGSSELYLPLPSGATGRALAVNNLGRVAGYISTGPTPVVWDNGMKMPPGSFVGAANDINNHNEVIGQTTPSGQERAFIWRYPWDSTSPQLLPQLPGAPRSTATAISDSHLVVGHTWAPIPLQNSKITYAVFWPSASQSPIQIQGVISRAEGVNLLGQVVGTHIPPGRGYRAFLWARRTPNDPVGKSTDLNDVVALPPGAGELRYTGGINDLGEIAAYNGDPATSFLLTPADCTVSATGATQCTTCRNPVDCARLAINTCYNIGGGTSTKGWDTAADEWLDSRTLRETACVDGVSGGIDCSGLIQWARARAWGINVLDSSAGSAALCSEAYSDALNTLDVTYPVAGDIMCFDYEHNDNTVDHIALFADSKVVESITRPHYSAELMGPTNQVAEFELTDVLDRRQLCGEERERCPKAFKEYRRLRASPSWPFYVRSQSPITVRVTDPDGVTIDHITVTRTREEVIRGIPDVLYYTDLDGHDGVWAPRVKQGRYLIEALPKEGAGPDETYSLAVGVSGAEIPIAQDAPVGEIPGEGYGVEVAAIGAAPFIPVQLHLDSSTVERDRSGVIPAVVFSTATFGASELAVSTLRLGTGGATEAHGRLHLEDVNLDGLPDAVLHFSVQALGLSSLGLAELLLSGQTESGAQVRGTASIWVK